MPETYSTSSTPENLIPVYDKGKKKRKNVRQEGQAKALKEMGR